MECVIRTGLANGMMKFADVLETISPVTGSLCRLAVGCSEAIVLASAGNLGRFLERGEDLVEADSGLKKKDALCIQLSPLH